MLLFPSDGGCCDSILSSHHSFSKNESVLITVLSILCVSKASEDRHFTLLCIYLYHQSAVLYFDLPLIK